jgi:hypothetical protein
MSGVVFTEEVRPPRGILAVPCHTKCVATSRARMALAEGGGGSRIACPAPRAAVTWHRVIYASAAVLVLLAMKGMDWGEIDAKWSILSMAFANVLYIYSMSEETGRHRLGGRYRNVAGVDAASLCATVVQAIAGLYSGALGSISIGFLRRKT